MNTSNVRWPNSLWAAATPPGPDLPELIGTQQADVIVIGGGFTGPVDRAASARGRRRRRDRRGDGAGMGRIGTQQRPGDPDAVAARSRGHHRKARRRRRALRRAAARQRLDAVRRRAPLPASRPSRSRPAGCSRCIRRAASRSRSGGCGNGRNSARRSNCCRANRSATCWDRTRGIGGFWNRTGGHINPLALARGLARAVLESRRADLCALAGGEL